jgi:hypothetical protein
MNSPRGKLSSMIVDERLTEDAFEGTDRIELRVQQWRWPHEPERQVQPLARARLAEPGKLMDEAVQQALAPFIFVVGPISPGVRVWTRDQRRARGLSIGFRDAI